VTVVTETQRSSTVDYPQALAVLNHPAVVAAQRNAQMRFSVLLGSDVTEAARVRMDCALREWSFRHVLLALNSDPNHPGVTRNLLCAPGPVGPGSRGPAAADDPDLDLAVIPVDGNARLRLSMSHSGSSDCTVQITTNLAQTLAGHADTVVAHWTTGTSTSRGQTFTLSIGPEADADNANHLQSTVDSRYVLIRTRRTDWMAPASGYRVERINATTAAPLTHDQIAALAARYIVDQVGNAYPIRRFHQPTAHGAGTEAWGARLFNAIDVNTLAASPDDAAGKLGHLVRGRLRLGPDEVFVVTMDTTDATLWSFTAYDFWLMTCDPANRCVSRNRSQTRISDDGTCTYVFSAYDPGVPNWIDIAGIDEPLVLGRFDMAGDPAGAPAVTGTIATLADVRSTEVDAVQRQVELTKRSESYAMRFLVDSHRASM
jgi:hypothetical protein